jgi:hypothetical protein
MMTADLALAMLINRTSEAFQANRPLYMTYTENTHINAPSLGQSHDVNRSVAVRVADNFAVMQDLPNGAQRTGQAFPLPAYFDPFSTFSFSYYVAPKRADITVTQGRLAFFSIPAPDPSVTAVVPYYSYWATRYASDSTDTALHLLIEPTSRLHGLYWSEVVEDPHSQLPSYVEMRATGGDDEVIAFNYQTIQGHWVLSHCSFTATQHALGMRFKTISDVTFSDIAFPEQAPDPRLAGTPVPATASP